MWTDAARRTDVVLRAMRWPLAAVLLAGGAGVEALSTDSAQPIDIVADRAEHDNPRRVAIYRGNVVIDQGSLHITGDTVTVVFDGHDDVAKMITVGVPAHFRQLTDGDASHRKAWARRMEYFPGYDLIVLFGEARYEKDGNDITADRLVYDSLNARFKALTAAPDAPADGAGDTAGTKPERVRIKLLPKKKPTQ